MAKARKAQTGKSVGPKYKYIENMYYSGKPTSRDSADYREGFYEGKSDIKKGKPKSSTKYDPQFGTTQRRLGYSEAYEKQKRGGRIKKK